MSLPSEPHNYWRSYWSGTTALFSQNPAESGARYPRELSEWIHRVEARILFERCRPTAEDIVADLGAGGGRFSLALAPAVRRVHAVEHSQLHDVLAGNAAPFSNIVCLKASIQEAVLPEPCTLALLSGVLMYATDDAATAILKKAAALLAEDGMLVLREPMRPGGLVNVDWKYHLPGERYEIREDRHFEVYRDPGWYTGVCAGLGLRAEGGCISHAPVFYFLPEWFPGRQRIRAAVTRLLADERRYPAMHAYDRILRIPYALLMRLLRKKTMRFLFFRKRMV